MTSPDAVRIGLTGGIGSGKSTVCAVLARCGAPVIDTDGIARRLTLPGGAAMPAIQSEFGAAFVAADGSLDRAAMRTAVFADAGMRRRLEEILHPLIGIEVAREAAVAHAAPAVVFDVPLLVETGRWRALVDRVWVVDCDEAVQVQRVAARPGWDETTARAVVAQQASRAQRRASADAVVDNSTMTLDELARAVGVLWRSATGVGATARETL